MAERGPWCVHGPDRRRGMDGRRCDLVKEWTVEMVPSVEPSETTRISQPEIGVEDVWLAEPFQIIHGFFKHANDAVLLVVCWDDNGKEY